MSNKQIKNILEDIYRIDDSLRVRGPQLEKIVAEILEARPKVSIDEKFKRELYKELMERVSLQQKRASKVNVWQWIFSKKLSYAFVGAVAVIVIVVGAGIFHIKSSRLEFKFTKTSLNDEAFGSLQGGETSQSPWDAPAGQGGGIEMGGGGTSRAEALRCLGQSGCVIPPYVFSEYVYKGGEIKLEQSRIEVLRKGSRMEYAKSFAGLLEAFGFGLADLSVFEDAKIQTVNLVQDKDFGYTVFINLDEGTISIDTYWPRWPQSLRCSDEKCVENQLQISDMPGDEELIRMANQFIDEYKINISAYGQPEVEKEWRREYEIAAKENRIYIPETISVLYPLLIDGKLVYEQGGTEVGMRVSINIRYKRVFGLYNLSFQNYESSMYDAETDASKIIKIAERGGVNNYIPEDVETQEVDLGTPSQAYIFLWRYSEETGNSQLLYVPALAFPIIKVPAEGYYYQKNIVVPLAKELLQEDMNKPVILESR